MSNKTMFNRPENVQPVVPTLPGVQDVAVHKSRLPLGWAIACIVLAAMGLRPTIVSVGPTLPHLVEAFHLTHVQAALLTAIPTLAMGVLALPTPWLAARFGRDRIIIAALLILAAASVLRAISITPWMLLLATAGTGAGIAFAGTLLPGYIKAGFPSRVAFLMGIYAMALSLGSTVAAATTGMLETLPGHWRSALGVWAMPALLGACAWGVVAKRERAMPSGPAVRDKAMWPVRHAMAWRIAAFFACNNIAFYSCIAWLAPRYIELGYTPASAGTLLASFTLAFMIGTFAFGMLSRHRDRRIWLATGASLTLMGMIWMSAMPTVLPFLAVSVMAFGIGGAFTLAMTLPLDNATTHGEAVAWNAFTLVVSYPVGAAGPMLVGVLREVTGGFATSLMMLMLTSGLMLALTPFLCPPHLRRQ